MRFAVISVLSLGSLLAQDAPVIRVNTRAVEVDVVVRDAEGPVPDLGPADFRVFHNGQQQTIASFTVDFVHGYQRAALPLREGEVSNRLNVRGEQAVGATVVLFDRLNTAPGDQSWVRQQVLDYLGSVERGDQFALYTLTSKVRVATDFTGDPERLIQAVKRGGPETSLDLATDDVAADLLAAVGTGDAATDAMQTNSIKEMQDFYLRKRAETTAGALEEIARHLGGMPGRKKLVWVTAGFKASQIDQRTRNGQTLIESLNFGTQIDRAVRALNEANIAVYPVDARGLTPDGLATTGLDTMNLFASGTGGRAFYGRNDLAASMREVAEDSEVTYTLTFYPQDVKLDGRFHSIDVKVDRKGVEVRHRNGYFATEEKAPTEKQRSQTIKDVFASDLEATGIGLSAYARPVPEEAGLYEVDLTIRLNELHVERKGDLWVADIDFATQFEGAEKGSLEDIVIRLNEKRFRQAMEGGFTIPRFVDAGKASGTLRIAIQDRATGAVGSIRVRLGER